MTTITLQLTVRYDPAKTDAGNIVLNANTLLENALSTPGILDDLGSPEFSDFELVDFNE